MVTFSPREEYFDAIIKWHKTRNGIEGLEPKHIGYENGVLGGVVSALNVLCSKGDSVLLHSPTYIGFTKSLTNNGYHIVHSPLVKDENNVYRMDFEDMEKEKSWRTISMQLFSAARTTQPAVYGSAGRSRRPWRSTRNMMYM